MSKFHRIGSHDLGHLHQEADMKPLKSILAGLLVAALGMAAGVAIAAPGARGFEHHGFEHHGFEHHGFEHHGGARVGVYLGGPVYGFGYPYYGYPYYGYPAYAYGYGAPVYYGPAATVVAPVSPPVYVEQGSAGATTGPASDGYWYYCHNPDGYYPYVKQCADGWQKVPSQPAGR
jgi:hypothetical protein